MIKKVDMMYFIEDDKEKDIYITEDKLETVFDDNSSIEKIEVDEEAEPVTAKEGYKIQAIILEEEKDGLAPIRISDEMRKSFLEYAMSVIVARALPDARDGLKPVHRRILYGMSDLGILPNAPHKKSARIVGDVLGKYHPHGDSSVYEAMVRMAQDFSMRHPLVDGHGNFGSIDGDSAAAMRYTEARMSKIALMMTTSIKKDTVNFIPNYDGSEEEPEVLPARFPNLLVTGATGIAVGMATNIPPHNLIEVINGVIALARNPELDIYNLMEYIKGPDFPTGATIIGRAGIIKAYTTGGGSITTRSKANIEVMKNKKSRIVFTEIPFMVNKAKLIEKIAILVKNKTIEGITDLRDETSRRGIRVVVDIKKGVVPEVVLNKLYKLTSLQSNFGVNMLALVNGEPKKLNLKEVLEVYIEHQKNVVTRRTKFDLKKAQDRHHILLGLKIAIENVDLIIKMIKSCKNDAEAIEGLSKEYDLSKVQSKAIVDMRLGRLTGLAIEKMVQEMKDLKIEIDGYNNILGNKDTLIDLIISELEEVKNKFGEARRTNIIDGEANIEDEDLIPVKQIAITMTGSGYVKRIPLEEYRSQKRGGVGANSMATYEDDFVDDIISTNTHIDLLILTSKGRVYKIRAHQIPEMSKQAKGVPFVNLISIQKDEEVVSLKPISSYKENEYLITVTQQGMIKKTKISEYKRVNRNGKFALGLREGDSLINTILVSDEDQIMIGADNGKVVRFESTDVRASGRKSMGVKGINLNTTTGIAKVIGADKTDGESLILSLGDKGFGKMTKVKDYRATKRGAKGVTTLTTAKAGKLVAIRVVEGNEDIITLTEKGITIRTSLKTVSISSRVTKGVKIIKLNDTNNIKSIAIIKSNETEESTNEIQEIK